MSKTQPLLDFYTDLLHSLNIVDVADGRLSLKVPNEDGEYTDLHCLSNDKRVVLPTDAILRSGSLDGMIAFHPLSENLLRGESEIIKFLRKMVKFRLSSVASQLLIELMAIAADPERHEDLSPRQAEYLRHVPNANAKTLKALSKLIENHSDDIINIYLKREGGRGDETYRRLAAVSFPIWEELNSPGTKVYEVDTGSAKNKKTIASLFEFVFPDIDHPEAWSVGSNSGVAPYFDALMRCYSSMARHLAKLVYKYRKYLDYPDLLRHNMDWDEGLDNLEKWKTLIPPLPGNEGAAKKGEKEPAPAAKPSKAPSFKPNYASVAQQTTTEAPEQDIPPWEEQPAAAAGTPAAPTTQPATGKIDWAATRHSAQQHQPTAPAWGGPQYNAPQYQNPGYHPPQQSHTTFPVGGGAPMGHPSPWGAPAPTQPWGGGSPGYGGGGTSI